MADQCRISILKIWPHARNSLRFRNLYGLPSPLPRSNPRKKIKTISIYIDYLETNDKHRLHLSKPRFVGVNEGYCACGSVFASCVIYDTNRKTTWSIRSLHMVAALLAVLLIGLRFARLFAKQVTLLESMIWLACRCLFLDSTSEDSPDSFKL